MEIVPCGGPCRSPEPYPEVRAQGRDGRYARAMLSNMGGVVSEMSAVSLYFYNHLVTTGVPEAAALFHEVSIVEMHHMEIFGTLALQLGADPRLWSIQRGRRMWWSPEYNQYVRKLGPLLQEAIRGEQAAIRKYESQLRWIGDENIRANLRRILLDERLHMEAFECLRRQFVSGSGGEHI